MEAGLPDWSDSHSASSETGLPGLVRGSGWVPPVFKAERKSDWESKPRVDSTVLGLACTR